MLGLWIFSGFLCLLAAGWTGLHWPMLLGNRMSPTLRTTMRTVWQYTRAWVCTGAHSSTQCCSIVVPSLMCTIASHHATSFYIECWVMVPCRRNARGFTDPLRPCIHHRGRSAPPKNCNLASRWRSSKACDCPLTKTRRRTKTCSWLRRSVCMIIMLRWRGTITDPLVFYKT